MYNTVIRSLQKLKNKYLRATYSQQRLGTTRNGCWEIRLQPASSDELRAHKEEDL